MFEVLSLCASCTTVPVCFPQSCSCSALSRSAAFTLLMGQTLWGCFNNSVRGRHCWAPHGWRLHMGVQGAYARDRAAPHCAPACWRSRRGGNTMVPPAWGSVWPRNARIWCARNTEVKIAKGSVEHCRCIRSKMGLPGPNSHSWSKRCPGCPMGVLGTQMGAHVVSAHT